MKLFAKVALVWSAVVTVAVAAMCVLVAMREASPLATVMVRMQEGDLMRPYFIVSGIASTFGQLAIAIRWFRLLLLRETPHFTLSMPAGSARYFSRSLILFFGVMVLAIPGFIFGGIVGRFVPGDVGRIGGVVIMIAGGLVAAYACIRAWLVFPAIAIGDEMDFRRSVALTAGSIRAIVVGTVIAFLPFVILMILIVGGIMVVQEMYLDGIFYVVGALLMEFASMFLMLGGIAASAGVLASIYREVVPDAHPDPDQIAAFE